jgi:hypothetical protein
VPGFGIGANIEDHGEQESRRAGDLFMELS